MCRYTTLSQQLTLNAEDMTESNDPFGVDIDMDMDMDASDSTTISDDEVL